jgi:PAS domain-containing protein
MIQQQSIEVILMRQLASYLAMPMFLADPAGNLLFYNEPAETLLGRRFDEVEPMGLEVWSTIFNPTDDNGAPIPPDGVPLVVALQHRRPAHSTLGITGLDGVSRRLEVTAFPLVGQGGRHLGAVAMFWEIGAR